MFDKRFEFADMYKNEVELESSKIVERLNAIASSARKCLATDDFQRYKKQFNDAQAGIIDALLAYNNSFFRQPSPDAVIYAMKVNQYLQKIADLRVLLNQVETEAQRKTSDEPQVS